MKEELLLRSTKGFCVGPGVGFKAPFFTTKYSGVILFMITLMENVDIVLTLV